mgnify:CR=1 FL=1
MIKIIQKIGNSHGIILDKAYLDHLGVREGSKVNISQSGDCLVIRSMEEAASDETVDQVMKSLFERYDEDLRELAK